VTATKLASLAVGDAIPELRIAPVSRTTLALFAGASGDHNPIHLDIDIAKKAGLGDVIAHGMLVMAWVGRMLTDFVPQSTLTSFGVRFNAITRIGDTLVCRGRVAEILDEGRSVRIEVQASDENGDVKVIGDAVIAITASQN